MLALGLWANYSVSLRVDDLISITEAAKSKLFVQ